MTKRGVCPPGVPFKQSSRDDWEHVASLSPPSIMKSRHDGAQAGDNSLLEPEEMVVPQGPTKDFGFLPIPRRLRYTGRPFSFGVILNASFGLGSTFTVMNLYYCQPLLIQFSKSFGVTYSEVSRIPTVVQAGYATGLLLLSPLGDLVRRRPLVLTLIFVALAFSIGLAVTASFNLFVALNFLVGVFTVTPQVLIPLAADLAPPERRASAISIVLAGLLFGVLLARVIAGVIAEFVTWRVVYYMSLGLQAGIFTVLYMVLPDQPAKNPDLTYFQILSSMAKFAVTEPILVQACLVSFAASATFTNFWVTLTFLLGGSPYFYSTLNIGLFGLIGMFGVAMGPLVGRLIDRLIPWTASVIATCVMLVFQSVQTAAGGIHIAAVIISCFGLDVGRQMQQVSLTTAIYSVDQSARARLNACLIIAIFVVCLIVSMKSVHPILIAFLQGQVMGTSAGTDIFVKFGWRAAAAFNMGLFGYQLLVLLVRGPHCRRFTWLGWEGGMEMRRSRVIVRNTSSDEEKTVGTGSSPPSGEMSEKPTRQPSPEPSGANAESEKVDEKASADS